MKCSTEKPTIYWQLLRKKCDIETKDSEKKNKYESEIVLSLQLKMKDTYFIIEIETEIQCHFSFYLKK